MSNGTGATAGPDGRLAGDLFVLRRIHLDRHLAEGNPNSSAFDRKRKRFSVHVDGIASAIGLGARGRPTVGVFAASVADLRREGFGVELLPTGGDPSHAEIFILPGGAPENMSDRERRRALARLFSRRPGVRFTG